jgi:hypothetical protein
MRFFGDSAFWGTALGTDWQAMRMTSLTNIVDKCRFVFEPLMVHHKNKDDPSDRLLFLS